jgi:hypothetical protein
MASRAIIARRQARVRFLSLVLVFVNILAWLLIAEQFLEGTPPATLVNQSSPSSLNFSSLPLPFSQTFEDCLFLDVIVPQSIYEASCGKENRENFNHGKLHSTSNDGGKFLHALYSLKSLESLI